MAGARRAPAGWKLTPTRKAKLIELLSKGVPRNEAAAQVGTTGTKIRAIMTEGAHNHDPAIAAELQAAIDEGDRAIADKLAAEGLRRQLDDETKMTDRGLHNERIFRDPAYRAAHRTRIEHSGGDKPVEMVFRFDPDALSDDELEQLDGLLAKAEGDGDGTGPHPD